MNVSDLRVISIGLDQTIALSDPELGDRGDARRRQEEYASLVANYTAVVKTPRSRAYREVRWDGRHAIIPTLSPTSMLFPADAYRIARAAYGETGADLVVTQDPFSTGLVGYLLKRRFGIPLCVQVHSDNIGSVWWLRESPRNRLLEPLGRWIVRRADSIQVVSRLIADRLAKAGVQRDRMWNLMSGAGIDTAQFMNADGTELRQRLLRDRYDRLVLFVGRMVWVKDLPTLLEAAAIVASRRPRTLFVLVGDGEERPRVATLLRERGLEDNVLLAGGVGPRDAPGYYAACDLFVMTSVYEGKARSLAEAACAGKPIVSTAVSGADEVVRDGETGFLVPVRDLAALADRVLSLLADDERARAMGRRGQELVSQAWERRRNLAYMSEMWLKTVTDGARHRGAEGVPGQ